jgi:hypothetical protein
MRIFKLVFRLVFKPAWQSKRQARALRAVAAMREPEQLVHVATEAYHCEVRLAAVAKISDQNILYDLAKGKNTSAVCIAAACKLEDRDVMREVIRYWGNEMKNESTEQSRQRYADNLIGVYKAIQAKDVRDEVRSFNGTYVKNVQIVVGKDHTDGAESHTDEMEDCWVQPCSGHTDSGGHTDLITKTYYGTTEKYFNV